MSKMRMILSSSVVGSVSLFCIGGAYADSAAITTTGPSSSQTITLDNSETSNTNNSTTVFVVNSNQQQGVSGDTSASNNTDVAGGLGSGSVTNNSATSTTIAVGSGVPVTTQSGDTSGGNGGSSGSVSNSSSNNTNINVTNSDLPGGKGAVVASSDGLVLGASTSSGGAGAAILPVAGPVDPVDVSALRNAWKAPSPAAVDDAPANANDLSVGMLITATALGLLGAVLSVLQVRRKNGRLA